MQHLQSSRIVVAQEPTEKPFFIALSASSSSTWFVCFFYAFLFRILSFPTAASSLYLAKTITWIDTQEVRRSANANKSHLCSLRDALRARIWKKKPNERKEKQRNRKPRKREKGKEKLYMRPIKEKEKRIAWDCASVFAPRKDETFACVKLSLSFILFLFSELMRRKWWKRKQRKKEQNRVRWLFSYDYLVRAHTLIPRKDQKTE